MLDLKNISLFISLSILVFPCHSKEVLLELKDDSTVSGVTEIKGKLEDSELTLFGITIGSSKLLDVTKKLKGNPISHNGDASLSLYFLCYKGKDDTIIVFESNGEMGGNDHTITSVEVYGAGSSYKFKQKCSNSFSINKELKLSNIRLGMNKLEVEKIKGKPGKELKNKLLYTYHSLKPTSKGPFDVTSTLEISLHNGKVQQFSISKLESN